MNLPVLDIALDPDLQPRAQIDETVLTEYTHLLASGHTFPPITVFFDGASYWLADGYHRWHAHRALSLAQIEAEVRQGSKREAMLHSLAANAEHGKQRCSSDLRKAYAIAVANQLVRADDAQGLAKLLRCSERWGRELTREAREATQRERDAAIIEARDSGLSTRETGRKLGIDQSTVVRAEARRQSSEPHHAVPARWAQVLSTLAALHSLPLVDDLFPPHPAAAEQAAQHLPHVLAWLEALSRRLHAAA